VGLNSVGVLSRVATKAKGFAGFIGVLTCWTIEAVGPTHDITVRSIGAINAFGLLWLRLEFSRDAVDAGGHAFFRLVPAFGAVVATRFSSNVGGGSANCTHAAIDLLALRLVLARDAVQAGRGALFVLVAAFGAVVAFCCSCNFRGRSSSEAL
jgi:hypothetical protein